MKKILFLILAFFATNTYSADIKISALPLGAASTTGVNDSLPYVSSALNITRRVTLWDLKNIPTIVSTYAPISNAVFTGTTTSPSFIGPLTGNASTANAFAANPTDCTSGQYANAIAANGNLTCAAVSTSQLSGTLGVSGGGTGLSSGTAGGVLAFTGSTTLVSSLGGSSGQILRSAGTSAPTWSSATYPSSTTVNQLLYSSSSNVVSEVSASNSSALVSSSSGVPSWAIGTTANRVLRTNGTSVSFSQVALDTDVQNQLPVANGGTGASTLTAFGVLYGNGASAVSATSVGSSGQILTSNGAGVAPTFQTASYTPPRSEVWVYTATGSGGVGSTNTAIRRFATTGKNTGSAITYADSATLGGTFTINETGIYGMTHCFQFTGLTVGGISLNSSQLTTSIDSITATDRVISAFTPGLNTGSCVSATTNLTSGDIIRAHITVGAGVGTTTVEDSFRITKINN